MAQSPPHKTTPDHDSRIPRPRTAPAAACFVALLAAGAAGNASAQSAPLPLACDDWGAEVSAVQGTVEVQRAESDAWTRVAAHDVVCFGDSVRVQAFGWAIVRLRDQTVVRIDQYSTLTLNQPDADGGSLIDLIRGLIHVISRNPHSLRFTTPYANAGIEGTEFDIRVAEQEHLTEIAVLEGEVVVTSPMGRIEVPSGYVGSARDGEMPIARAIVDPIELMRWASYFPEILDADLPAPDREPQGAEASDAGFFALRAAARLRRGNLEAAEADIASSLRLEPGNATALALGATAALGRNDAATAHERAILATGVTPPAPAAFIALSYVLQAGGDLDGALASVASAISLDPQNAIASARRAEIQLGRGQWNEGLAAATHAIELRPRMGYTHAVLGFVRLSAGETDDAIDAFEQAAALDQGAPLPHIGLALALMQRGDFVEGRQHLELAVALDPANALTRSYMGKTYDAENRPRLPGTQLELAKRFDPNDPTPWLYDALLKLNRNRPIEALQDLLGAISRNDNRALFRSRLAMDADLATRSAGTGRVLRELGFEQLALVRGWAATAVDPTDYAAHRLLADVYSVRPREEISRVSELWMSQLLQPANLTPIQPQLGQATPLLVSRAAPSELAFTELAPLVTTNGLKLEASSVAGANQTFGEQVALAGLRDRVSYGFGQFHFKTDGFRENNDFDQTVANAFVQVNVDERTSLLAELRSSDVERGDTSQFFDSLHYGTTFRVNESADTLRLGGRRRIGDSDTLLVSVSRLDNSTEGSSQFVLLNGTNDATGIDLQHIHTGTGWNLRTGISWANSDDLAIYRDVQEGVVGEETRAPFESDQHSAYAYADVGVASELTLTLGASADAVHDAYGDKDELNPKIGLTWIPNDKVTVRAASFETLLGNLLTTKQNPQPRLEPGQVAGFNQFLFGAPTDISTVTGLAVDGRISARVFVGAELLNRAVESSLVPFPGSTFALPANFSERSARTYLYWTPREDVSFNAQYLAERVHADPATPLALTHVRTQRLPLEARYFSANGLSAGLRASRFHQQGEFLPTGDPTEAAIPGEDRFWLVDASVGFRLPNRRGVLSFNVDNLFNEDFRFQDLDPENPSILPERTAYFRFTLSFD
jgi:tetratricopeptide (TPR) repeat protein